MKTLNNFIVERLKINNDSKISKNIPRKFVYKTIYTETEVDIIEKYAQQLEIKPVLITNEEYLSKYRSSRSRSSSSSSLFLYFDDDLENTYRIWFIKDELSNNWSCRLLFKYDEYCYYVQDKKGNKLYSKNVEDICKELLIQIKDTRFYEEAKKFYMEHFECDKLSITERLKLNSDSKISGIIPTKFSENIIYTENEIEIIQRYAQKLRIRPTILTSYEYDDEKLTLTDSYNGINLFYDNNWETKKQLTYITLWKFDDLWKCRIWINNKRNDVATKKGGFFKSKNIEDVCKELLIQIGKTNFYDEVKNLK